MQAPGIELMSRCLLGKCFTNWAILAAPLLYFPWVLIQSKELLKSHIRKTDKTFISNHQLYLNWMCCPWEPGKLLLRKCFLVVVVFWVFVVVCLFGWFWPCWDDAVILALGKPVSAKLSWRAELQMCRERIMARGISSVFYEPFCLEKDFVQKFPLSLYALVHREMIASSTMMLSRCRKRETHPLCVGRMGMDLWVSDALSPGVRLAKQGQPAALTHSRIVWLPPQLPASDFPWTPGNAWIRALHVPFL